MADDKIVLSGYDETRSWAEGRVVYRFQHQVTLRRTKSGVDLRVKTDIDPVGEHKVRGVAGIIKYANAVMAPESITVTFEDGTIESVTNTRGAALADRRLSEITSVVIHHDWNDQSWDARFDVPDATAAAAPTVTIAIQARNGAPAPFDQPLAVTCDGFRILATVEPTSAPNPGPLSIGEIDVPVAPGEAPGTWVSDWLPSHRLWEWLDPIDGLEPCPDADDEGVIWATTNLDLITTQLGDQIDSLIARRAGTDQQDTDTRFLLSERIAAHIEQRADLLFELSEVLKHHRDELNGEAAETANRDLEKVLGQLGSLDLLRLQERNQWSTDAWAEYFDPEYFQEHVINRSHKTALRWIKWKLDVIFKASNAIDFVLEGGEYPGLLLPLPPRLDFGPGLRSYPEWPPSAIMRHRCVPRLVGTRRDRGDELISVPSLPLGPLVGDVELVVPGEEQREVVAACKRFMKWLIETNKPSQFDDWRDVYEWAYRTDQNVARILKYRAETRNLGPSEETKQKLKDYDWVREAGLRPENPPIDARSRYTSAYRDEHDIPRGSGTDVDHMAGAAMHRLFPPGWSPNFPENMTPLQWRLNQREKGQNIERFVAEMYDAKLAEPGVADLTDDERREWFTSMMEEVFERFGGQFGTPVAPDVVPRSFLDEEILELFDRDTAGH